MIVRILSSGKSFKGLSDYLTHDAQAKTDERVAWTHTHNLANDDVPCAVNEMLWTARDAELLKQEAGIRGGGRATENPVKHVSLNWAPEDNPSREHMIETSEEFLRHMKWQEHQVIFVAHDDKQHAHVHLMLNVVNPETGLRLDDGFERRRAQAWALEYEREQGRIHCEQRLKKPEEREDSPPRNIHMAFRENQEKFERDEKSMRDQAEIQAEQLKNQKNAEWEILKEIQRNERTDFFAMGKSEFSQLRSSIYHEVREEFRGQWADFYSAQKGDVDADTLVALKAELVAGQKAVLDSRRDEACAELRQARDERYRRILDDQRDMRAQLHQRQEAGLDSALFLQELRDGNGSDGIAAFRRAGEEVAGREDDSGRENTGPVFGDASRRDDSGRVTGPEVSGEATLGLGMRALSLFDTFILGPFEAPAPPPRQASGFEAAAEDAVKQQQAREVKELEDERSRVERWRYGERSGG